MIFKLSFPVVPPQTDCGFKPQPPQQQPGPPQPPQQPTVPVMTNAASPCETKPCYSLPGYPDPSISRSSSEYAPSPYYTATKPQIKPTKILQQEDDKSKTIPKSETASSCCRPDMIVKPEVTSCRSPPPPPLRQPTYDSYLNHDSNSSSVSSMDTMGHHHLHPPPHLPVPPPPVPPHHIHPPPPPSFNSMGIVEDNRSLQHRSPYDNSLTNSSEEMYQRSERNYTTSARPSYGSNGSTTEMPAVSRGYEVRPYDSSYERYDASCPQQPRYPSEYSESGYETQHQQMPIMKQDQPNEGQENNEGPLYPR